MEKFLGLLIILCPLLSQVKGQGKYLIYTRQKRNEPRRTDQLPGRLTSDGPASFVSVQSYDRYCCITHLLFLLLSCWISSSDGTRLSRPNNTQILILCKFYL